ncbi:rod shape-determining protein [Streptomyces violascens]|uniref:rod shape-determining protein n=1 Tax=Streptomyces violascens TaxID=67381 RepID=UPI00369EC78C
MNCNPGQLRRCTIAFDLGSARTRIYLRGVGLILDEASTAALDTRTGRLIAVGSHAQGMDGCAPNHVHIIHPVSDGTVTDIDIAQRMLRLFVRTRIRRLWRHNALLRAAICVPHDAHPLARWAAVETLSGLGTRRVELVDNLIAAATGCGLPVEQPVATMIVECTAASTHVAILSLGAVVAAERVAVGGQTIDGATAELVRAAHGLVLPPGELHALCLAISTDHVERDARVCGRDVVTGLWRTVTLGVGGVREVARAQLAAVVHAISRVLRACPPELVADLSDQGMTLTGASTILPVLDRVITDATGLTVRTAAQPELCTVTGLVTMLEGMSHPRP